MNHCYSRKSKFTHGCVNNLGKNVVNNLKLKVNLDPWRLTRILTLTNEFFFGNLLILAAINKLAADSNLPNELVSFAQKD